MSKKTFQPLLVLFCLLIPALGQTKPAAPAQPKQTMPATRGPIDQSTVAQDDVVRISANLVQVDAVVTKDGRSVPDLKAEDFEIFEDGRRQTITSFAYISNVPASTSPPPASTGSDKTAVLVPPAPLKRNDPRRTIAIVVDDLGLSAESISQARGHLRKFIAEKLQPNDLVAIIRTGGDMGVLQQFTNDRRILNRAVDKLRWNFCSRVGVNVFPASSSETFKDSSESGCGKGSYGETLKALQFILDAMGKLPGRKSMVLLSDSVPTEDQELRFNEEMLGSSSSQVTDFTSYNRPLQKIAEKAIRSSVVIYSVDTQGLQTTGITAADSFHGSAREVANQMNDLIATRSHLIQDRRAGGDLLARQTGGFQIRNSNDYQMDRILEDQSGYYLLGYRPSDETFNKRFHHIKAKVKRSGMYLRTRFGFYGFSEEEANRLTDRDTTNLALASPFGAQAIELDSTSFFAHDQAVGSVVRSFLYLNAKDLTFAVVNGRYKAEIELHGVIFGDYGAVVEQVTHNVLMRLQPMDYEQALRDGLRIRFDMPVKRPGLYQVRVAARDTASDRIGSAGQFVAVPDLKNKRLATSGIVLRGVVDAAGQAETIRETTTTPAARRFQPNSELDFALEIYNASIDAASKLPNLVMEARLFRDGKSIYRSPETAVDVANQPDLARVFCTSVVRLTPDLEPGDYYLQVVVTDKLATNKQPPVVQWIDFEIVKNQ